MQQRTKKLASNITLYVLPNCPSCEVAKYILGKLGIEYITKNAEDGKPSVALAEAMAEREGQAPFLVIEESDSE